MLLLVLLVSRCCCCCAMLLSLGGTCWQLCPATFTLNLLLLLQLLLQLAAATFLLTMRFRFLLLLLLLLSCRLHLLLTLLLCLLLLLLLLVLLLLLDLSALLLQQRPLADPVGCRLLNHLVLIRIVPQQVVPVAVRLWEAVCTQQNSNPGSSNKATAKTQQANRSPGDRRALANFPAQCTTDPAVWRVSTASNV